ncbi:MAG: hypothetical protein L6Q81_05675 [Bacteroidia bacterium]|nr:hypothetical protein [Bacteroidia bacterium]
MRYTLLLIPFLVLGSRYTFAQTVIKQDGKFGLADENGSIILKPNYDTVIAKATMPTFFILKNEGKFAYTYKVQTDSTTWLNEKEQYWTVSEFEFDSLYIRALAIQVHEDVSRTLYTHLQYKKNGLWGMIIIQSHLLSGSGIFVSAGSYATGLGRSYRREARYDAILGFEMDGFYVSRREGKYGLMNPGTNEDYTPEFDTIPVFKGWISYGSDVGRRERYVRKNGKWGVIQMNAKTKTLQYSVPCSCNEVKKVGVNTYACSGFGDTITLFDTLAHTSFIPLVNGSPIIVSKHSTRVLINEYDLSEKDSSDTKPFVLLVNNSKYPSPEKAAGHNEIYLIDLVTQKVTAYNDSGTYYNLYLGTTYLISQANLHPSSSNAQYKFYDLGTKEFLFDLVLDSNYLLRYSFYHPPRCYPEERYDMVELFYYDKKDRKKILGYYNSNTKRFTRRKPKCK